MSPLSNATTLANYASGIGTQGATLEVDSNNKRVGIGTTNPQGPEGSLQVGTAVTISGNSGIVSATTFHGDFGSSTSVAGNLNVSGVITYEDVTNIDSIGIMTARSDLSIADKIIHTGDTNTAIRFPAADTFTVETDGSERLRVNSDGFLGIKTSSVSAPLHVYDVSNNTMARLESGDATCRLQLKDNTGEGYVLATGDNLIFANTSSITERVRIDFCWADGDWAPQILVISLVHQSDATVELLCTSKRTLIGGWYYGWSVCWDRNGGVNAVSEMENGYLLECIPITPSACVSTALVI